MRRVCFCISAVSTFLLASCPENPANAIALGAPSVIRTAIADIAVYLPGALPSRAGAPSILAPRWMCPRICQPLVSLLLLPRSVIRLVTQQWHIPQQHVQIGGLNGRPRWRAQITLYPVVRSHCHHDICAAGGGNRRGSRALWAVRSGRESNMTHVEPQNSRDLRFSWSSFI